MTLICAPAAAESLSDAVRFALKDNPSLKASQADMRATTYEMMSLRGEFLPTLDLVSEFGYQRVDDHTALSAADNDTTKSRSHMGLNGKVVLFDGLRRANMVYAEAARVDGSIFRLLDTSETLALNATEAYIDVVRHQTLLGVAHRNVAKHREIGRRVFDLVVGGRLPYSDELTVDDRITAARVAQLEVERSLRDALARYARVIGREPSGAMALARARVPASLDALTQFAIANNNRIQFSQAEVDRIKYREQAVMAEASPVVSFNYGLNRELNRNGATGQRNDAYIGLGVTWKLYQGGRKAERNAMAERSYKAKYERQVAVRDISELATRSWINLTSNAERAAFLSQQLQINKAIVIVYGEEFDAAKRTLLDLLEVERNHFNVEFQKVSSDASVAFSTYRVLAAQGTLAEHFGIKRTDIAPMPGFQKKALISPMSVFDVAIEPLK
ncbi:TolC family protein [Sulfitobacter sp.]|uniref:TolC family protein n=1 Tax=Sulfitobacter sp. TaxID=1903071 RepID=UPI0030029291